MAWPPEPPVLAGMLCGGAGVVCSIECWPPPGRLWRPRTASPCAWAADLRDLSPLGVPLTTVMAIGGGL